MRLQYIDDSSRDTRWMAGLLSSDRSIDLKTNSSLRDFLDDPDSGTPDCILIDVMRPDSSSMLDDVTSLRQRTQAPVIFVTGSEAGLLRRAAVDAGSEGVLEKCNLTRDVVVEFARNAIVRSSGAHTRHRRFAVLDSPRKQEIKIRDRRGSIAPITSLLSANLTQIVGRLDDELVPVELASDLRTVAETAKGLDAYVQTDQSCVEAVDIRNVIITASRTVDEAARQHNVNVIWQPTSMTYAQIGSFEQAVEAMKHLCLGVFRTLGDNAVILVTNERDEETGGVNILIYGTGMYLPSGWEAFHQEEGRRRMPLEAQSSLALAMHLFAATPQRLRISQRSMTAVLSLTL